MILSLGPALAPRVSGIAYLDPLEICEIDSGPDCAQRVPASHDPRETFRKPRNLPR